MRPVAGIGPQKLQTLGVIPPTGGAPVATLVSTRLTPEGTLVVKTPDGIIIDNALVTGPPKDLKEVIVPDLHAPDYPNQAIRKVTTEGKVKYYAGATEVPFDALRRLPKPEALPTQSVVFKRPGSDTPEQGTLYRVSTVTLDGKQTVTQSLYDVGGKAVSGGFDIVSEK